MNQDQPGLRKWDFVLLPLVALGTVVLMAGMAELTARILWPMSEPTACQRLVNGMPRDIPGCREMAKAAEGPWVEYRFNDCGYRASQPCRPRPDGLRIAILGTSLAEGYWVAYPQSLAGRVEADLRRKLLKPVDVQVVTAGRGGAAPAAVWGQVADLASEALALRPDALVLVLAPFDLSEYRGTAQQSAPVAAAPRDTLMGRVLGIASQVKSDSRALSMSLHFFYLDLDRYLPLYLKHGDEADFLRVPFTERWRTRVAWADDIIRRIAEEARAANVSFIVEFVPSRAQAALARSGAHQGIDPFALGEALRAGIAGQGTEFIDLTPVMAGITDQSNLYFPVDGHPTADGQAIIASALERQLTSGRSAVAQSRVDAASNE